MSVKIQRKHYAYTIIFLHFLLSSFSSAVFRVSIFFSVLHLYVTLFFQQLLDVPYDLIALQERKSLTQSSCHILFPRIAKNPKSELLLSLSSGTGVTTPYLSKAQG